MSTRGTWGFVLDGTEYLSYNHSDSYPSGLGVDILAWARQADWSKVREQVAALTLVEDDAEPTAEQAAATGLTPEHVSTGRDWYSLLRSTQGDPQATLDLGIMTDGHEFPLDSLFCEWAYVIDLDAETLEVYQGFQKTLPDAGRWAGREEEAQAEYKAIQRREAYPLSDLPSEEVFLERHEG